MSTESYIANGVVITLLVLNLIVVARVAMFIQQIRDTKPLANGDKSSTDLLKQIGVDVSDLKRESLPTDGASMSFRMNNGNAMLTELLKGQQYQRSAAEQAVSAARSAQENNARLERNQGELQGTLNQIAIALGHQADNTGKIINLIQTGQTGGVAASGGAHLETGRDITGGSVIRSGDAVVVKKPEGTT